MKNKKTIQKILVGLVIAIAILVGYSFFMGGSTENQGPSSALRSAFKETGTVDDNEVQLANSEILRILGSIQDINLDTDIFSNPVFNNLEGTNYVINKPSFVGRANPFLPIGFTSETFNNVPEIVEEVTEPVDEFFSPNQEL